MVSKMTRRDAYEMTGEQFRDASFDEKMEALNIEISAFNFQKKWCEEHSYMDKRNWEYRQHKEFMLDHRSKLVEWLTAIGAECLPYEETK